MNLLVTFCKVVELGSFTKTASYLKQPKSRVSRAISSLESSMNVQLINRTTRSFSLTEAGQQLFEKVSPLLEDINSELNRIETKSDDVSGIINISAPEDIGQFLLIDLIDMYLKQHPGAGVNLQLSNHYVDFSKENFDLAFRAGELKDSSIIHKKIAKLQLIFVASKTYLQKYGTPKNLDELERHKVIYFVSKGRIEPSRIFKKVPEPYYASSSFSYIYKTIREGKAIGLVPEFFCKDDFATGAVQRVLKDVSVPHSTLQVVYPHAKNLPMKTRSFIDFAVQNINLSEFKKS